jgi:integrase
VSHVYQSHFRQYIEGLIAQKRALGFPYLGSRDYLRQFDQMCLNEFPDETVLTKEIGQMWGTIRDTEKRVSFQNRMAPIRELAKYMLRLGISAYIVEPMAIPDKVRRSIPHIFTDSELSAFFSAADNLEYNDRGKIRHLIVPVVFRLMYCCGLRPHEARLIKKENMDFTSKTLKIPESKGHKDRMVVMPDDISLLAQKYLSLTQEGFAENEYLFPSWRTNSFLCDRWLSQMFRLCWNTSGIKSFSGNSPTPYSFRHTFATKRLYAWLKEGKDLDAYLPYLSAYMGHAHFSHTAYYIHLVPEFFPQMAQMDLSRYAELIPEVYI